MSERDDEWVEVDEDEEEYEDDIGINPLEEWLYSEING